MGMEEKAMTFETWMASLGSRVDDTKGILTVRSTGRGSAMREQSAESNVDSAHLVPELYKVHFNWLVA